jgi:F-box/leucine-rich repeat protein 2/20
MSDGCILPDEVLTKIFTEVLRSSPLTLLLTIPNVCKHWAWVCHTQMTIDLHRVWYRRHRGSSLYRPCVRSLRNFKRVRTFTPYTIHELHSVLHSGTMASNLRALDLRECQVIDVNVNALVGLNKLESLAILDCDITDVGAAEAIKHCPQLKKLRIPYCGDVTGTFLENGSALSHLTHLNFCGCYNLEVVCLLAVAGGCPQLEHLDVAFCKKLTSVGIEAVAKGCPKLKFLDVTSIDNVTESIVAALEHLDLRTLWMSFCRGVTDREARAIAQDCPNLENLRLSGCNLTDRGAAALAGLPLATLSITDVSDHITDRGIIAITRGCPKLVDLSIAQCRGLTDLSARAVAGCSNLISLDMTECYQLTDGGLCAVAQGCAKLRSLDVTRCCDLTSISILAILNGCPQLEWLDIGKCSSLSAEFLADIQQRFPNCVYNTE